MSRRILAAAVSTAVIASPAIAQGDQLAWERVDQALGRTGSVQADGIRRYAFPRTDLAVQLDGVAVKPALALSSWVAFQEHGRQATVMGDLVLTHDEVNPVLSKLLAGGVTVNALHNHLLRSKPATMYMHIHGHGDPVALATSIRSALSHSKTPTGASSNPAPGKIELTTDTIEKVIGSKGTANGGVYQFSIRRTERIMENGMPVSATMGLGTVINFQPTGGGKSAVTGDFVLTAPEVTPVLTALRRNDIEVTALHNHLAGEQPRLLFLHFWAHAETEKLARGLRQALDQVNLIRN